MLHAATLTTRSVKPPLQPPQPAPSTTTDIQDNAHKQ